jgi:hypothetical protein
MKDRQKNKSRSGSYKFSILSSAIQKILLKTGKTGDNKWLGCKKVELKEIIF